MKKIITSLFISVSLATIGGTFTSCQRIAEAVSEIEVPVPFDISTSAETSIPFAIINTFDNFISFPEITLDIDADAKIKEKYPSLSVNNLRSTKLSSLSIELLKSNLSGNFDAIADAQVFIKTPDLPELQIASKISSNTGNAIEFVVTNAELINYIKNPKNSLIIKVKGKKLVLDQFTIKVNPSFRISLGI